jgi:hypothetical protein
MIMDINEPWADDQTASIDHSAGFSLYFGSHGFDTVAPDQQTAPVPRIAGAVDNAGVGYKGGRLRPRYRSTGCAGKRKNE